MNRRDFLRKTAYMGAGLAILPLLEAGRAEAAWQSGGLAGVSVRETHLAFGPLENRARTDAIVVHHIGDTNADVSAETVHAWHKANGWSGIGYHFVIRKNGTIERGRPMDTIGAHCYGENAHTVGVNIVGNFETAWPEDAQLDAAARLISAISANYGFAPQKNTVFGHRDFNATACPGRNLYGLLPDLIERARAIYMGR